MSILKGNRIITCGLLLGYSRPLSCFAALNKTYIMDLIGSQRARARGMETNYVAVAVRLCAIDLSEHSPHRRGL